MQLTLPVRTSLPRIYYGSSWSLLRRWKSVYGRLPHEVQKSITEGNLHIPAEREGKSGEVLEQEQMLQRMQSGAERQLMQGLVQQHHPSMQLSTGQPVLMVQQQEAVPEQMRC